MWAARVPPKPSPPCQSLTSLTYAYHLWLWHLYLDSHIETMFKSCQAFLPPIHHTCTDLSICMATIPPQAFPLHLKDCKSFSCSVINAAGQNTAAEALDPALCWVPSSLTPCELLSSSRHTAGPVLYSDSIPSPNRHQCLASSCLPLIPLGNRGSYKYLQGVNCSLPKSNYSSLWCYQKKKSSPWLCTPFNKTSPFTVFLQETLQTFILKETFCLIQNAEDFKNVILLL